MKNLVFLIRSRSRVFIHHSEVNIRERIEYSISNYRGIFI